MRLLSAPNQKIGEPEEDCLTVECNPAIVASGLRGPKTGPCSSSYQANTRTEARLIQGRSAL
jgi:hypothetical protein